MLKGVIAFVILLHENSEMSLWRGVMKLSFKERMRHSALISGPRVEYFFGTIIIIAYYGSNSCNLPASANRFS